MTNDGVTSEKMMNRCVTMIFIVSNTSAVNHDRISMIAHRPRDDSNQLQQQIKPIPDNSTPG